MKGILFTKKGVAEKVLRYQEIELQEPTENEIKVKVLCSPLNPNDFMFIEKTYRIQPEFPQIAGLEGAGIIANNDGDPNYPVGALVAFRHKNCWAQYVNVPKQKLVLLPNDFPVNKAAQLSLNPLTACALLDQLNTKEDGYILISAANSSIGKLLIQFAVQQRINVIAIVRSLNQKNDLIEIGAKNVILEGELEKDLEHLSDSKLISGFLDSVGGDLTSKVLNFLAPNAKIIHYGLLSNSNVSYHNSTLIFKNLTKICSLLIRTVFTFFIKSSRIFCFIFVPGSKKNFISFIWQCKS